MKHIILFLLLIYSTSASSTVYNVAATGGNYSTIAQVNAATFVAGDQILFNKGETFYGTLIVQSGSVSNPIVYGAYGTGANPIITGFTTVSSWTNLGGSIWESNVLTDGLTDCNIVTINGVNTAMGRTPNSGSYWNVDSYSANTSITSSSLIGATDWSTSGAAEVVIRKQSWDWYRNTINTHVSGTVTYTMQQTTGWTPKNNWGFFIQNDVRTLDIQNEWYYNPITKRISIYSTSQPVNVKATTKEQVLTCDTKNYVTVDGIKFEGGNTAILYSLNSANIIIQNCIVSQFGYYGVSATNTDNSLITACTFTDGNSSAIFQNGTFRAFEIKGDSMLPLQSGTIIVGQYIDNWRDVKEGKTYVVITKDEGIVYKRLLKGSTAQSILLKSES